MGTKKAFGAVTKDNVRRGCDGWGCGSFGSNRSGHTHKGLDIKTVVGQEIYAPISGTVTRFPFPYSGDLTYTGIEIKNELFLVKIFYCSPLVAVNAKVTQGQLIAKAQNIALKYSATMTNHVHVEVYDIKTGKLINPETLF